MRRTHLVLSLRKQRSTPIRNGNPIFSLVYQSFRQFSRRSCEHLQVKCVSALCIAKGSRKFDIRSRMRLCMQHMQVTRCAVGDLMRVRSRHFPFRIGGREGEPGHKNSMIFLATEIAKRFRSRQLLFLLILPVARPVPGNALSFLLCVNRQGFLIH